MTRSRRTVRYNIGTADNSSNPPPKRTERRLVALSVGMSVVFGPIGIEICRIPVLGGISVSLTRMLEFTGLFAVYGLAMGIALSFAWRVENPGRPRRDPRRKPAENDYWIGDWNSLLDGAVPDRTAPSGDLSQADGHDQRREGDTTDVP